MKSLTDLDAEHAVRARPPFVPPPCLPCPLAPAAFLASLPAGMACAVVSVLSKPLCRPAPRRPPAAVLVPKETTSVWLTPTAGQAVDTVLEAQGAPSPSGQDTPRVGI